MMKFAVWMKLLTLIFISFVTSACVNLTSLPPKQPDKATVVLYDSDAFPMLGDRRIYLDNQLAGKISSSKPSIFYLSPGTHKLEIKFPASEYDVTHFLNLQSNRYYFLRIYNANLGGWGSKFILQEVDMTTAQKALGFK